MSTSDLESKLDKGNDERELAKAVGDTHQLQSLIEKGEWGSKQLGGGLYNSPE